MRLTALLAAGAAVAKAQDVVKIMPLGDSITGSPVRSVPSFSITMRGRCL